MEIVKVDYDLKIDYKTIMSEDWEEALREPLLDTPYMENLMLFLHERYKLPGIFPQKNDVFKVFKESSFTDIKVVILCKEPYANFKSVGIPLANKDNITYPFSPELTTWIKGVEKFSYEGFALAQCPLFIDLRDQGVFFMDVALTCEASLTPMKHKIHWRNFTRQVIKTICEYHEDTIFVLLGKEAQEFEKYILNDNFVIKAEHPSEALIAKTEWVPSFIDEINFLLESLQGPDNQIIW
jgi:uracil-DNA glycosylase